MDQTITDNIYPIEFRWIFKPLWRFSFVLIILALYFFSSIGHTSSTSFFIYSILILITIIIVALIRANFHYTISNKFITVEQGVLSKQQRNIPYGVIQNISIKQDSYDRVFGLATLIIENATHGI